MQTVGVYTLISQIGQGGMGSVWLAERNDGRFDRRVAIKFLNLALIGKAGERASNVKATYSSRLADPHIAELLDAGVSQAGQGPPFSNTSRATTSIAIAINAGSVWEHGCGYFSKCWKRYRMRMPT